MLTSFFGKSKPVHFLILGAFMALGFIWTVFINPTTEIETFSVLYNILILGVILLSLILLDFIVGKNQLTKRNAYSIFFYACFMVMLPMVFLNSEILLANFFLLLALRRIISLRKDTNSEKKILDTAIWTTIASLFYFWSILFLIPLFIAIIQKPNLTFKQMLIPMVGFIAVLLINTACQVLMYNSFSWIFNWEQPVGLDFSAYNSSAILIPTTVILTLLIFTLFFRWRSLALISLKEKSNYMVFFIIVATTLIIVICSPNKDGSELVFLCAPIAILCANYIEGSDKFGLQPQDKAESWFKEILLWMVCIIAFIFLFL